MLIKWSDDANTNTNTYKTFAFLFNGALKMVGRFIDWKYKNKYEQGSRSARLSPQSMIGYARKLFIIVTIVP